MFFIIVSSKYSSVLSLQLGSGSSVSRRRNQPDGEREAEKEALFPVQEVPNAAVDPGGRRGRGQRQVHGGRLEKVLLHLLITRCYLELISHCESYQEVAFPFSSTATGN